MGFILSRNVPSDNAGTLRTYSSHDASVGGTRMRPTTDTSIATGKKPITITIGNSQRAPRASAMSVVTVKDTALIWALYERGTTSMRPHWVHGNGLRAVMFAHEMRA